MGSVALSLLPSIWKKQYAVRSKRDALPTSRLHYILFAGDSQYRTQQVMAAGALAPLVALLTHRSEGVREQAARAVACLAKHKEQVRGFC